MAGATQGLALDRDQVKKAVQALQAFLESKFASKTLFQDDTQPVSLLFTLWKIPRKQQTIRIPLPHNQRTEVDEVCLFTRDEPNMTPDQTQRFYKRLLQEKGIQCVPEIIPYKMLKTEYKAFEAKRRLLGNFDVFLSDARIRRLLPSHLGKHFYERKSEPLSVNLQSKQLARDIKNLVQGTRIKINNRGCCCMARIAHSGMTTEEITENIVAAVKTVVAKLQTKGPVMKIIHLKSEKSVALPIYTSDLSHLAILEEAKRLACSKDATLKRRKAKRGDGAKKTDATTDEEPENKQNSDDEEMPQLVPMATPVKKPKLEKPNTQKTLEKAPKAAGQKVPLGKAKRTKKAAKITSQKPKRKVSKAK